MSKLTTDHYAESLKRAKLVDAKQLEKVLSQLRLELGEARAKDANLLAERLVEQKLITPWQNEILLEGRQDSLMDGKQKGFFLGSYKLLGHLGTGGMNAVFLAEHVVMRRQAAIKVLPLKGDEDKTFLERFHRESQATAALDHPNIVRAHDFGTQGQVHYLVMEYVEGRDLQRLVQDEGPLPYARAADYIAQSAAGLSHAHEVGMVHRDIKPANLLLDLKGVIKLLDLGLARLDTGNHESSLTKEHKENILGTADYVAPEQALDSHNVDARADIYSLGCTLYFLLTGHPPFPHGSLAQRMLMHQIQTPQSIYQDRPDAPAVLVSICERMMAKKAPQRYQTAAEVEKVLRTWLSSNTAESKPAATGGGLRPSLGADLGQFDTSNGLGTATMADMIDAAAGGADVKVLCRTCGTSFGQRIHRSKCPKCGTVHDKAGPSSGDTGLSLGDVTSAGTSLNFGGFNSGAPGENSATGLGLSGLVGNPGLGNPGLGGTSPAGMKRGSDIGIAGSLGGNTSGSGIGKAGSGIGKKGSGIGKGDPAGGGASVPKTEGPIRASCPACGANFSAPWRTCLSCGAATIVRDVEAGGATAQAPEATVRGDTFRRATEATQTEEQDYPQQDPSAEQYAADDQQAEQYQDQAEGDGAEAHSSEEPQTPPSRLSSSEIRQLTAEARRPDSRLSASESRPVFDDPLSTADPAAKPSTRLERPKPRRRNLKPMILGLAVLLLIGGGVGALALTGKLPTGAGSADDEAPRYANGMPKYEGAKSEGLEEGPWIYWNESRQKTSEGSYREGKKTGPWSVWDENGQLVETGNYDNDQRQGEWLFRYPEGHRKEAGSYRAGKRHGKWTFWTPAGEKQKEGEFEDDKEVGAWTEWDAAGKQTTKEHAAKPASTSLPPK